MAVSVRDLDSDVNLVIAAQTGDRDAFAELFRRHYDAVRRSCARRLGNLRDADEIAQAAFVRAWERIDRCAGERRFGGWVQVIAHHLCVDALRDRSRVTPFETPARDARAPLGEEPEGALLRHESADLLRAALADLPPRQREVVVARDLEDRRPGEIAAALGLSVGAVDSLLLRGRRRLASVVERLSDDHGAITTSSATSVAAAGAGSTNRFSAVVDTVQHFVDRASYQIATALGAVPGVPSQIQRAAGAAALGGALLASSAVGGGGHGAVVPAEPTQGPTVSQPALPAAPAIPAAPVGVPAVGFAPAVGVTPPGVPQAASLPAPPAVNEAGRDLVPGAVTGVGAVVNRLVTAVGRILGR